MSADLEAACAKVGRYLYEFALLERDINASMGADEPLSRPTHQA